MSKSLANVLDAIRICAALRDVAAELRIDADALVDRWRRRVEHQVSAGVSQTDAENEAFRNVTTDARRRRTEIDRWARRR